MRRSKQQNSVLDAAILTAFDGSAWATAFELLNRTRQALGGTGLTRIDATDVGARLRSLKSRGRVEGRFLEEAAMNEWRRAG